MVKQEVERAPRRLTLVEVAERIHESAIILLHMSGFDYVQQLEAGTVEDSLNEHWVRMDYHLVDEPTRKKLIPKLRRLAEQDAQRNGHR